MATRRRDDALAPGLATWLRERTGEDVSVAIERPGSGLSSDTLLAEVRGTDGTRRLVVRLPRPTGAVFPDYDLERQYRVQLALRSVPDIPTAVPVALETDPSWLGAPFLVMERVAGRTPTTAPPYTASGWLHDADPAAQRRVVDGFAGLLARIHRVQPGHLDPPLAADELSGGGPGLVGMLDYWAAYLDWATPERAATRDYRAALDWLRRHVPVPGPAGLLWGDPQLGNVVYDDQLRVAAALDWEMAALGPAEVDLGWFLALHEAAAEVAGRDLAGYPGRDAFVARYCAELGRAVCDIDWYVLFGHVRSGAIVVRIGELMSRAGVPNGWTKHVPQLKHVLRIVDGS